MLFTDDAYAVRDSSWLDANSGYALLYGSGLARTEDGGRHWRQLYPAPPGLPQGPVSFSFATQGIGVGTRSLRGSAGAMRQPVGWRLTRTPGVLRPRGG